MQLVPIVFSTELNSIQAMNTINIYSIVNLSLMYVTVTALFQLLIT